MVNVAIFSICHFLLTSETESVVRAFESAAQCIVIGPVCGFVCVFVGVFVGLKLRASIFTKLGL